MKTVVVVCHALLVILLAAVSVCAWEWRWEEDDSFLNPNISPELARLRYGNRAVGLRDLNGDQRPEYVLAYSGEQRASLHLATCEGNFPDLHWNLRANFFPALDAGEDTVISSVSFFDLSGDGAVEIILNSHIILENRGSFDQPDWVRADALFPNIDRRGGAARFCDWDNDGQPDLIVSTLPDATEIPDTLSEAGLFRYERNHGGGWDSLGFIPTTFGILLQLADLDGNGTLDLIGGELSFSWNGAQHDLPGYYLYGSFITLNTGTANDPRWSAPRFYEDLYQPFPYDLNSDGHIDLVNGWRYTLNLAGEDSLTWERPVIWGGAYYPMAIADFTGDGSPEILSSSLHSRSFMDHRWRLVQLEKDDAGWHDSRFLGNDFGDWGSGFTDMWGITATNFVGDAEPEIAVAYSRGMGENTPVLDLYRDFDAGEGWDWRPVGGYFDELLDTISYVFQPAFGDFDSDGDLDVAMTSGGEDMYGRLHFFEADTRQGNPRWVLRNDWLTSLMDTLRIQSIAAGDFNDDGRADLLTVQYAPSGLADQRNVRLFTNQIGQENAPPWRLERHAFDQGGPATAWGVIAGDVDGDGRTDIIAGGAIWLNRSTTDVEVKPTVPMAFTISSFPNPFNPRATIRFTLPASCHARLALFDLAGREVYRISEGEFSAGVHAVVMDVADLAAGIYWVRLEAGGRTETAKAVVLK